MVEFSPLTSLTLSMAIGPPWVIKSVSTSTAMIFPPLLP
jgi:hypothetical protein